MQGFGHRGDQRVVAPGLPLGLPPGLPRGLAKQRHLVLGVFLVDDQPRLGDLGMAFEHLGDLARGHEHALDLGRLVGAAFPSRQPHAGAPAGAQPRHDRGQIAGGEADQRIFAVQRGNDDLADVAFGHRLAGAGTDDFDDDAVIDDEALHGLRFIGDQAQIGARVCLQGEDAGGLEFLAQPVGQGLARNHGFVDAAGVDARLVGRIEEDLEERRRSRISVGTELADGLDLLFGLSGAGGDHGAADGAGAGLDHHSGRRQVIGKGVVDDVAGAEAGGVHGPAEPPPVGAVGLALVGGPGGLVEVNEIARRDVGHAGQRRVFFL